MRGLFLVGLMMVSVLASTVAGAGAYRWVDDQGKVHYGDQPPTGAQRLNAPPGPATNNAGAEADREPGQQDDPEATSGVDKGVYKTASFAEICKVLNNRLQTYRGNEKLATEGPGGQPQLMSAEERTKLINDTQEQATEACKQAEKQAQ